MTKYTKEKLEEVVKDCYSYADVARQMGTAPVGGITTNIKNRIIKYNIDTSHFTGQGWRKGLTAKNKMHFSEVLVYDDSEFPIRKGARLRKALLEAGVEYKCASCGTIEWNDEPITLHVDHINGKYWDHRQDNLRFLCPNCHSQTETYSNKKR